MNTFKAYRINKANGALWYIANLKGKGGKDWGYSTDPRLAIPLSTYWRRRLLSDMRSIGDAVHFY